MWSQLFFLRLLRAHTVEAQTGEARFGLDLRTETTNCKGSIEPAKGWFWDAVRHRSVFFPALPSEREAWSVNYWKHEMNWY